eukprot:COSAG06_NODE_71356_length_185_cov_17.093023_1_plen_39_part_10
MSLKHHHLYCVSGLSMHHLEGMSMRLVLPQLPCTVYVDG